MNKIDYNNVHPNFKWNGIALDFPNLLIAAYDLIKEGEEFERDINNIIGIIDGVEKNMNPNRLNNQFARNQTVSYNRRKIEMSRTIQA